MLAVACAEFDIPDFPDVQLPNQRDEDASSSSTPYPTYTPYPTFTPLPDTVGTPVPQIRETSAPTPLAVLPDVTPTPEPEPTATPTPIPAAEATATAQRRTTENLKRCDFWALNNLRPIVYAHFAELDPYNMDDFDRTLWRTLLHVDSSGDYYGDDVLNYIGARRGSPSEWCQDYWTEALSPANAHKRNEELKNYCYQRLSEEVEGTNEHFGAAIYDERAPRNAINQYVRIMNWMDIGVEELLRMEETPYQLIRRLLSDKNGKYEYATDSGYPHQEDELDNDDLEWFGVADAWADSFRNFGCDAYYPQLFYNRWIPLDLDMDEYEDSNATPVPLSDIVNQGPNRDLFVPDKYIQE